MNFRVTIKTFLLFICALTGAHSSLTAQELRLSQPIEGEYLKDFYIVNYVDQSEPGAILDGHCGSKTYDGHEGTDFVLRNFAQMDAGVNVLAAAPGDVIVVVDSLFDRNKVGNDGQLGNYVGIAHANGIFTYYAHLRTKSATVKVGQTVETGDVLGLVGSSGNSTDPHLHMEVWRQDSTVIDPFSGTCGDGTSWWAEELPYNDELLLLDVGIVNGTTTLDELRERPATVERFTPESSEQISFWVQQSGIRDGDVSRIDWLQPDGSLWFTFETTSERDFWFFYWWSFIDYPATGQTGEWTARYSVNEEVITTQEFEVGRTTSVEASGTERPDGLRLYAAEREIRLSNNASADNIAMLQLELTVHDLSGRLLTKLPLASLGNRDGAIQHYATIPQHLDGKLLLSLTIDSQRVSMLHFVSPD